MTVMFYASNEVDVSEVSSTSWTEVASVSGNAGLGEYKVHVSCEYAGVLVDEIIGARFLIDGVEVSIDHYKTVLSNQYRKYTDFIMASLTEGSHTVSLETRCLDASQSVKVRRKRLLVEKH